jgi:hypothetical protein
MRERMDKEGTDLDLPKFYRIADIKLWEGETVIGFLLRVYIPILLLLLLNHLLSRIENGVVGQLQRCKCSAPERSGPVSPFL